MPQGPLFETPLDVISRLKQQREAAYGSGDAAQIFQAQIGSLVDSLVGNPEVKRAQRINDKIYAKMGAPVGDEMEQEIQKLKAARDVYAEAGDLNRASMFNQQLLQLQVAKQEQRKLQADTTRIENEEARQQEMHEIDVGNKGSEYENWINRGTGKSMGVPADDAVLKQQLASQGWEPAGKPTLQGSAEDIFGHPTPPVQTDLQTALLGARDQQANLRQVMSTYKPEFTQWVTQAKFAAGRLAEKLDIGAVPPAFKEQATQYVAWRRNTRDSLNRYIKFITGAQMSKYEIDRIRGAFPNEDNSHTEFMSSIREVMKQAMAAEKRANMALQNGLGLEGGDAIAAKMGDLTGYMPSDAEVDAVLGVQAETKKKKTLDERLDCIKRGGSDCR